MAGRLRWAVQTSSWVPSEQEWTQVLSLLQTEEVDRVGKFVYQSDAKFAAVGRLLIWAGLSEHLGSDQLRVKGYTLIRSERGKPMLLDGVGREVTQVGFNISHQGDYVVLATEPAKKVGVDVMQVSQPRGNSLEEFFKLMRRKFTEKEWSQIVPSHLIPQKQQLRNFYRFWCLKESFIKAEGSGLSYGLQNLEFACSGACGGTSASWDGVAYNTASQLSIRGKLASGWHFQEYMLDSEHCAAVAVPDPSPQSSSPAPAFTLLTVPWLLSKLQPYSSSATACNAQTQWKHFKLKPN